MSLGVVLLPLPGVSPWSLTLMVLVAGTISQMAESEATTAAAAAADPETTRASRPMKNVTGFILEHISSSMDYRVRPFVNEKPVKVRCGFYIVSFGSISELDMDYSIDIYLRQEWTDPRMEYSTDLGVTHIVLSSRAIEGIWTPDIFFPNEKAAYFHDVTVANRMMKVFPNGHVKFSVRITMRVACPMDLTHFPLDHQRCHLSLESYAFETADLILTWSDEDPIDINPTLELPQFDLLNWETVECNKQYKTGNFPCLRAQFTLQRQYGFFLLQTYIPSILIVILSWVSFWINMDAVPARISLGVTTVLTMATQLSGAKASIPKVSYPKAIDVWMATCMLFVFLALLEYAFVNAMSRKRDKQKNNSTDTEDDDNNSNRCNISPDFAKKYFDSRNTARIMDKVSRVAFPLTFLIFNIIYWAYYATPSF